MAIVCRCLSVAFWIGYAWCLIVIVANSLPYFGDAGRWQPFLLEKGAIGQAPWYLFALRLHVIGGILCLAAVLVSFSPSWLRKVPALHRWTGRMYGLAVIFLVCLPGLPMSFFAKGGTAGQAGFLILGALTFWTTWRGIQAARQRDIAAHRDWMIRSFALVASAITFRLLHIGLYLAASALDDPTSYVICLYASTLGNLAIAEWMISRTRIPKRKRRKRREPNEDNRTYTRLGRGPHGHRPDPVAPFSG